MNRFVLYFCFVILFLPQVLLSQDTLSYRNGSVQLVKILEVSTQHVKYKKFEFLSGPTYIVSVDEVKFISYADGKKEKFPKNTAEDNMSNESYSNSAALIPPATKPYKKSGPRVGCTYIGEGSAATEITDMGKTPFVTQLGWEFEARIYRSASGMAGMLEFNFMLAGIEQGLVIPNGNILLGVRGREGMEVALGPNLSPSGLGMEFMIGGTLQLKDMYFPVNVSFVPSVKKTETTYSYTGKEHTETIETGFRVSLIIGFYTKEK